MKKNGKPILTLLSVFIFLCIPALSAWAEAGSPVKTVKEFTRAYFMIDPKIADYLSKDALINENEENRVDLYLDKKAAEARNSGYSIGYLQMLPITVKTSVLHMDDVSASIQVNATTIRSINPLYRMVGYVFGLLEEHEVQGVVTAVKEDGNWKIGPGAFDMPL